MQMEIHLRPKGGTGGLAHPAVWRRDYFFSGLVVDFCTVFGYILTGVDLTLLHGGQPCEAQLWGLVFQPFTSYA
jgi:hypothetical protein